MFSGFIETEQWHEMGEGRNSRERVIFSSLNEIDKDYDIGVGGDSDVNGDNDD